MNTYTLSAAILCFLLGLVHSILGEYLIFKEKRIKGRFVPSKTGVELKERHLRILWATWHLTSLFGWCIGAFLIKVSLQKTSLNSDLIDFIITSTSYTMLAAALLVLLATKGKHPGWIILLLIAVLLITGS
ncbi:hypothetical protein [uncultured Roseivirga sp.]|mgnify:FL=1|uniref:hypothetical protein n=1 Tax=uncultured Roseivirga sp. TaxID=543088 RepID=UPI0030DC004E|tara:strand:- start:183666 stop:184058 length:393 start_codon:yes stop_codon:yes gene_type:complete